jgi:hypothetical protein
MTSKKWTVAIPADRWMGGYLHRFGTLSRAQSFIQKWNAAERSAGRDEVRFHRSGLTHFEAA